MKKFFLFGVFLYLMFMMSCNKDEFTEQNAMEAQKDIVTHQDSIDQARDSIDQVNSYLRDSLNKLGGIFEYSVSVVPVNAGTGFLKSASSINMLDKAVVTISQHGVVVVDSTDQSGIAVFYDLRLGEVNVNVQCDGYTSLSFIAKIKAETDEDTHLYYDVVRHATSMVPVFSLNEGTSNISGQVTYETDLTNDMPEIAAGVTVIGVIDVDDPGFKNNYFGDISLTGTPCEDCTVAKVIQVAYSDLMGSGVTNGQGEYSFEIPSSADGLPIKMEISDVAVNQSLILDVFNGKNLVDVYTVRTLFSTDNTAGATSIPTPAVLPAATVQFSQPTGIAAQQPIEAAEATAVIGESGISAIIITNQGRGYTQAPIVQITTNGFGTGAEAIAYLSQGRVTEIEISEPGSGYHTDDVITVTLLDKIGDDATATAHVTYSVEEFVINLADHGAGYQSVPEVTVISNSGSGASGSAIIAGYVSNVEVINMGNGYVCPPVVVFDAASNDFTGAADATATAVMTTHNPIHSIKLSDAFIDNANNIYETVPTVVIDNPTYEGSGATAIAQLESAGELSRLELTNAGLGYTEAPAVLVVGGGGTGAAAYATLNVDGSINVLVADGGQGYTSVPTIEITAAPDGGTSATATAVLAYRINKLAITNPGSAYNITSTGNGTYGNQPTIIIDGTPVNGAQVTVRPNMMVKEITFTAGYGYTSVPNITIEPACGFGAGATAIAEVLYSVDRIEVVNAGSGYDWNAIIEVIVVTPPEGCTQQATVNNTVLGNGTLASITLTEAGEYYTAPPLVTLSGAGVNAELPVIEALISGGSVTGFTIVSPGSKFSVQPDASFSININTNQTAATCLADAYTESGKISFVTIDDPGAGYTTQPLIRFIRVDGSNNEYPSGSFIDAEATAVVEDGRIVSVDITNPGTGYYYKPKVEIFIPLYIETATATLTIDNGYVKATNITNGGMGYETAPTLTFIPTVDGIGSGATATAYVTGGVVTRVVMDSYGSGYLGKNTPTAAKPIVFMPTGTPLTTFEVIGGKAYIRDIYLGTGVRTIQ